MEELSKPLGKVISKKNGHATITKFMYHVAQMCKAKYLLGMSGTLDSRTKIHFENVLPTIQKYHFTHGVRPKPMVSKLELYNDDNVIDKIRATALSYLQSGMSVIVSCDVEPEGESFTDREKFEGFNVYTFKKSKNMSSAEVSSLKKEVHNDPNPVVLYIDLVFSRGTNFKLAKNAAGIIVFKNPTTNNVIQAIGRCTRSITTSTFTTYF